MTVQGMSMWKFPTISGVQVLHTTHRYKFCLQGICNLVRLEAIPK